jgi:ligand-binding sensor protein
MKLTDLLPIEKWIALEEEMNRHSGLDTNIFDTDGIRITPFKSWANHLCPEIKANDKGQSFICAVAHQNLAVSAKQSGKSIIEECDAGIVKIIVPIFLDDEFLGTAGACGLRLEDGEIDSFLINKVTGIDMEKIEHLSNDIPFITRKEADSLVEFIEGAFTKIVEDFKQTSKR